jgi:hypothetical protein
MYVFVTEDRPTNERIDPAHWPRMLADLLAPFGAPLVQSIRAQVGPQSHCIYRPLESLLLPQPWFDARVVLVGDAVHATTPHMAAGAGIGIEDGIVLAEELGRGATVQAALQAFQARRWERCRMVVENSGRLGEIEISGGDKAEHTRIMHETHQRLAQQSDDRSHDGNEPFCGTRGPCGARRSAGRRRCGRGCGHPPARIRHRRPADLALCRHGRSGRLAGMVGTLIGAYRLDPQQAGLLATLFLAGAVVGSLFFSPRLNRLPARHGDARFRHGDARVRRHRVD